MTRRLVGLDRLSVILTGAALVALAVLAVLWHQDVAPFTGPLTLPILSDLLGNPFVLIGIALLGVLLVLLGLRWLVGHSPTPAPSKVKLAGSTAEGWQRVDLGSLAQCLAQDLAERAPVTSASGSVLEEDGASFVQLRARVTSGADAATLVSAAEQTIADFAAAFPQTPLACRVLYDQPEAELVRRIRKPLSQQAARVE